MVFARPEPYRMAERFVDNFMAESETVADLRDNPLLLSLMCSLYRHQNYIPRNRPQVYESCTKLLFDLWDRRRSLRPRFAFDAHVDGAVEYLASWIFSSQKRQVGVSQPEIIRSVGDYLYRRQYQNADEALYAARELIEFCKGRAWVLTDTGTLANGVSLFQFTHRTFLEYLTASYYCNNYSEGEIHSLVSEKYTMASWYIVCQLIIQWASERRRGLEDRILITIEGQLDSIPADQRTLGLDLCQWALENVPLSPDTIKVIVTRLLKRYIRNIRETFQSSLRTL